MHNSPGCSRHRFPDPPDFFRRPAARVLQYDRLRGAYRPRMRCALRSADDSCPRQERKTLTACRRQQNKKYGNLRWLPGAATVRAVREQIRAAAKIVRKTFSLPPCFSLANQCDQSNAFSFSVLSSDHQFQPRPGFINRAHFYIDEPERQRDSANHVFRHISRHARRSFCPGNPNSSGGRDFFTQYGQSLLQFAALLDKNVDKTRIGLQTIRKSYAFGNCT